MGCDIHLFVETRETDGAPWQLREVRAGDKPGFHDRNYDLFGMLADVRNGVGFAGVVTGDGFTPIDKPRGLPNNMSAELQAIEIGENIDDDVVYKKHGTSWLGDHSHSWITLAELDAYDWAGQRTMKSGYVTPDEYKQWKEHGHPETWCGGVTGRSVRHLSNEEMEQLKPEDGLSYYTRVSWGVTYAEAAGRFLTVFLPALRALGADPKNTRIVFGFDS